MEEIAVQGQALGRAFFRVKLGGKNIISSCGAAKWQTINSFAQRVVNLVGNRIITVYKIKITTISDSIPDRMGF